MTRSPRRLTTQLSSRGRRATMNPESDHAAPVCCSAWFGVLLFRAGGRVERQRPKLSDGGHEARRLQLRRPATVRCSAWLGGGAVSTVPPRSPSFIAFPEHIANEIVNEKGDGS